MTKDTDNVSRAEAQEALDSAAMANSAGWRRGVPARWVGAVISALIGSMFAIYALDDPGRYIVFPIVAMAAIIATSRETSAAYGREISGAAKDRWKLALFAVVLLIVFFGSIIIRRSYDVPWVSLLTGLLVALFVYWVSARERRAYLAAAGQDQ